MDWSENFKCERAVTWEEIAQSIHDTVTIEDALRTYAPEIKTKGNRCPCPIHHGKDYNFSFTKTGFKCFVCGAGGDVIALVKELQGCSTRADAMRQMNEDMHLGLPIGGYEVDPVALMQMNERVKKAQMLSEEQEKWEQEYSRLWDEYCALDCIILFSADFLAVARAKERMGYVTYLIDNMPSKPK